MKSNPWHPVLVSAGILLIAPQSSFGFSGFLTTWRGIYPSSTSSNVVGCATCHVGTGGGNPWNAYGWAVRQAYYGSAASNIVAAIRSVEGNDADGDGSTNLIEITANTLPGWRKGNVHISYFKNNTTTSGNAPISTTTALDPRKIVSWILGQGLTGNNALEDADPDKDGATNREEYLFGGMANNSASFPKPVVSSNGGANPSFTVDVRVNDPEFTITPKWSQNLTSFFSSGFTTRVDGVSSFGTSYALRRYETNLGGLDKVFLRAEGVLTTP